MPLWHIYTPVGAYRTEDKKALSAALTSACPAAAVPVSDGRGGELVLGQHRGDVGPQVRRVVQILDIGAVHTKEGAEADRCETVDDAVDHPPLNGHRCNTLHFLWCRTGSRSSRRGEVVAGDEIR